MRAREAVARIRDVARRGWAWRRRPYARLREVRVDLAGACARPAAASTRRARVARGRGALRLLREHGERRLQAVREVAGLGLGARHRALALVEQRVEVAHERLRPRSG